MDSCIVLLSIFIAYLLRFNFRIPERYFDPSQIDSLYHVIPVVFIIRFSSFIISRSYAGIIRYTGTKDAARIFKVLSIGSFIFVSINMLTKFWSGSNLIPVSVIGIDFLVGMFFLVSIRLFIKIMYLEYINNQKNRLNAIIYGISELAILTKRTLSKDIDSNYKVVAFIDPTHTQVGKKIDGLNVYRANELEKLILRYDIKILILAEKHIPPGIKNEVVDTCLSHNIDLHALPDVTKWVNGELSPGQIRKFKIEDLLEREAIQLNEEKIREYTKDKTILVTGAAGSIGSEIVKQLLKFKPGKIVIFDQAESPLYNLELELSEKFHFNKFEIVIGDIRNPVRVKRIFEVFKPEVVFHAAAYKHVPMMENNPSESIFTNIYGTKLIADLSLNYGVLKFVMISTDKAVKPTNVMGASKRIAEMYVQSLNGHKKTQFITTRFGNVLGSNGSVINRFRDQIAKGGPVTVTHPKITRYFMTIPEACQLVLEAGSMGKGGEIFIFDMGKSVQIAKLAKKMIQLSGLELGKDIEIKYTGLRPGEKLYEELLNDKENTLPTYHPQIMIGKVQACSLKEIEKNLTDLILLAKFQNNFALVEKMKMIVPDFISQNSIYEEIDEKLNRKKNKKTEIKDAKLVKIK